VFAQLRVNGVTVDVGETDVEQRQIDLVLAAQGDALFAGQRAVDGIAFAFEKLGDQRVQVFVVFDDQQTGGIHNMGGSSR
jgi:hypothetical protein